MISPFALWSGGYRNGASNSKQDSTIDTGAAVIQNAVTRQKDAQDLMVSRASPVQQFYEGSVVFLTGGSGFLGKQLAEKLLRSCKINKLFMLLRPKKGKTVEERLEEILKDPIYDTLRQYQPNFADKIVPIVGDIAELDLGISDEDKQLIMKQVDIIFHVAATITFQAPLRTATVTNVRGTRDLIKLAKQCRQLRKFVHFSTAYSHATFRKRGDVVLEQFYPSPIPPDLMIDLADSLDDDRLNGITNGLIKDWPNTYAFTKALAEELVRSSAGDLPICIIRPTVVICARREPYAGWVDLSSIMGPNGIILGCMMGIIHALHTDQDIKIDFVPVDYVSNVAIAAATTAAGPKIYTVGSSCRNHITWGGLSNILNNVARKTIVTPKAIWYCFVLQSSNIYLYSVYAFLLHTIPASIVDGLAVILDKKPRLKKIYAQITKVGSVVAYYTNNDWIFDDKNTLDLYKNLSETDKMIYHCNITDIEWKEQVLLWCTGLRKFVIKDGLQDTAWAVKKQFYFKMATYFLDVVFIYVFWWMLGCLFVFLKFVFM